MVLQGDQIFVTLEALEPSNLESKAIEWRGDTGFFDESTTISRRRGLEDGYLQWTGPPVPQTGDNEDSYDGEDYSMWLSPQKERKHELTLDQSCEGLFSNEGELGLIVQIM
jgi:hypothetical protein